MLAFICNIIDCLLRRFWKKELEITIVGLQNAGKTSFVNVISNGQYYDNMIPTVGFNMRKFCKGRVSIKIWDLGGQSRFRGMWERYCRGVDAIVYVVDAANLEKLDESTKELHNLLQTSMLRSVPILILGNKRDLSGSLTEKELIKKMNLDSIEGRKVYCYTISCKCKENLDTVLQCLISHAKS